ncbi:GNAT family protein [Lipingzhangella sp. LS1_29]|uniref:GNAT family protein n=1 Tax=Lipingzhangella rawalii TaxID=2055835 RepID=A0ABU2H0P0_9ACTN|nr:GNAT family protein [Lipingzhangella rawalii]MDS1268876.1 GNAT family protein [Lipingzhangella rawalii]
MIDLRALREKPTLHGKRVRLVPLSLDHAPDVYRSVLDEETRRLTGTHHEFTWEEIEEWCRTRPDQPDRLDLAVLEEPTGRFAGELSLADVNPDNESASYRIALSSSEFTDRGLGKESTRLVLSYAFDVIGLHRVGLDVYAFNMRAVAAYRACGFSIEGRLREALYWEGRWHDTLVMGVLDKEFRAQENTELSE